MKPFKLILAAIMAATVFQASADEPSALRQQSSTAQLRGVMSPMRNMTVDDFDTLEEWGVTLIRYQMTREFMRRGYGEGGKEGYDKWLAGKIDHLLDFVIPQCRMRGMKVVVDLHDAPGGRLDDCLDWALYYDKEKLDHFFDCWRMIASRVKGNEDVVYGYDLLNEPVQTREPTTMDYWDVQLAAAKIYIGEFSVAAWATGGENWLRDVIAVMGEYGWDWTYHAFREWNPWSVEHEGGPDDKKMVRSADNPRKQALLKGLKGETPIDSAIQLSEERPSAATKSCRE